MSFKVSRTCFLQAFTEIPKPKPLPSKDIVRYWRSPSTNRQVLIPALTRLNALKDQSAIHVQQNMRKLVSQNAFPFAFSLTILQYYLPNTSSIEELLYSYASDAFLTKKLEGRDIACLTSQYLACVDIYHGGLLLDTLSSKDLDEHNQSRVKCAKSYLRTQFELNARGYSVTRAQQQDTQLVRHVHTATNDSLDSAKRCKNEKEHPAKQYKFEVIAYCLEPGSIHDWDALNNVVKKAGLNNQYYLDLLYCGAELVECQELNRERLVEDLHKLTDEEWLRLYSCLKLNSEFSSLAEKIKLYLTHTSISWADNLVNTTKDNPKIKPLIGKVTYG